MVMPFPPHNEWVKLRPRDHLVANVLSESPCNSNANGYVGLNDVNDLTDASALTFTSVSPIQLGGIGNSCYMGLMVISQGGRYAVLDFLEVTANGYGLDFEYWVGDAGVTDFSQAPD